MRLIVFFDLPVQTKKQRYDAAVFRNFLLKEGYYMMQFSVYSRICNGVDSAKKHSERLKKNLPLYGSVRLLTVTEGQFEKMEILLGVAHHHDKYEQTKMVLDF